MAETITQVIQLRRGLFDATRQSEFPDLQVIPSSYILEAGEGCYEVDTQRLKIGDGIKPYSELAYIGIEGSVQVDEKSIIFKDGKLSLNGFEEATVNYIPYKKEDGSLGWKELKQTDLEQRVEYLEQHAYKDDVQYIEIFGGNANGWTEV